MASKPLILDSGPLGQIAHPKRHADVGTWFRGLLVAQTVIVVPEVADYEVRRNFILEGFTASIARLDGLKQSLVYLPLTTETMLRAAELWAEARRRGRPTGDPNELDGDVILAAQALQVGAAVVTDNVGHLSQFVEARTWKEIA